VFLFSCVFITTTIASAALKFFEMTTVKVDEVAHVERDGGIDHDEDLKQPLDNFNEVITVISSDYASTHNL
jgi:hypothetical protein